MARRMSATRLASPSTFKPELQEHPKLPPDRATTNVTETSAVHISAQNFRHTFTPPYLTADQRHRVSVFFARELQEALQTTSLVPTRTPRVFKRPSCFDTHCSDKDTVPCLPSPEEPLLAPSTATSPLCVHCPRTSSTIRAIFITSALCLVSFSQNFGNSIGSGFHIPHFTARNVSGELYGLVGSGVGIGNAMVPLLDQICLSLLARCGVKVSASIRRTLLITVFSIFVTNFLYGCSEFIVDSNFFAWACLVLRVVLGIINFVVMRLFVECSRTWFPGVFQLVYNLVTGTFSYVGFALASLLGGYIYDRWGFAAPFFVSSGCSFISFIICFMALPHSNIPIIPEKVSLEVPEKKRKRRVQRQVSVRDPLTALILLPVLAQFLVNMSGGYLMITTTPYLEACCGVPLSRGGSYVMLYCIIVAVGFVVGGFISNKGWISLNSQALLGCSLVIIGMLITFHSPDTHLLYSNSHYVAYVGIILVGLGDPICVSVVLRYMEHVQTHLRARHISPAQKSICSSIWIIFWCSGFYAGFFAAGIFTEYTSTAFGAWMMALLCAAGMAIFLALQILEKFFLERLRYNKRYTMVVYNF